jgi:hypothetical protein
VLEELPTPDFTHYYLRAGRIYHSSGRLWTSHYDLSDGRKRRTIYADSGRMGFNQDTTDLFLTLLRRNVHGQQQPPATFERVRFDAEERQGRRQQGGPGGR